jgi:hypothetical protein
MAIWKFVLVMSERSTEEISRSPLLLAWLVGMAAMVIALIVVPNFFPESLFLVSLPTRLRVLVAATLYLQSTALIYF